MDSRCLRYSQGGLFVQLERAQDRLVTIGSDNKKILRILKLTIIDSAATVGALSMGAPIHPGEVLSTLAYGFTVELYLQIFDTGNIARSRL